MTQKPSNVTQDRDTSAKNTVTLSRAHALLKEGCHVVTPVTEQHRDVTHQRDSDSPDSGRSRHGLSRLPVLTRAHFEEQA